MVSDWKIKGDIGTANVISDLTVKGYNVFVPAVCEHLPFDLIAYKDGASYRIQSKYSSIEKVSNKTTWNDKNGTHQKYYDLSDFDYYSIYLPKADVVVYPSIKFGGVGIRTSVPNAANPFYWYKDFLEFTDEAEKKTYRDFGVELTGTKGPRPTMRKVERPSKSELKKLLWEKPADFGTQLLAQISE